MPDRSPSPDAFTSDPEPRAMAFVLVSIAIYWPCVAWWWLA